MVPASRVPERVLAAIDDFRVSPDSHKSHRSALGSLRCFSASGGNGGTTAVDTPQQPAVGPLLAFSDASCEVAFEDQFYEGRTHKDAEVLAIMALCDLALTVWWLVPQASAQRTVHHLLPARNCLA